MIQEPEGMLEMIWKNKGKFVAGLAGVLLATTVVFGSWYQVDEGEKAVVLFNGAVTGVVDSGLNFKWPILEEAVKFSLREEAASYRMETYSKDQQLADLKVSINYKIDPTKVAEIYSTFGSIENLVAVVIDRQLPRFVKEVFGQYNAVSIINDRSGLGVAIETKVRDELAESFLIITSVQIEDVAFSEIYERSIEERMQAEVEVSKLKQNLAREQVQKEILETQAEAKKNAAIAEAQGAAEAIKLRGQAEAEAIMARGEALNDNPNLVALVQAEKWNGILPTTMVPGGTVPFLNLNSGDSLATPLPSK